MVGQIAKVIANLIVLGSGILIRAVSQAYKQAMINASKSGVAQETLQNMAHKSSKAMTVHEAMLVLGVNENTPWEDVLKKYETLFERNAKFGSFYIQSKVQRAKECLEAEEMRKRKTAAADRTLYPFQLSGSEVDGLAQVEAHGAQ